MFSVYGASGRLFRGTLEQLRQISPVHAPDRAPRIQPIATEGGPREPVPGVPAGLTHAGRPGTLRDAARDALQAYAAAGDPPGGRWGHRTAASAMHQPVLVLQQSDTVSAAWRQLEAQQHAQAPVVSRAQVLVGLVTLPMLARRALAARVSTAAAGAEPTVGECMLTPVPSVAPGADLRRVAGLLLESALPALPVVDEQGAVVGILSRTDLLRAVLDDTAIDQWG